jgi:hypothetical protein
MQVDLQINTNAYYVFLSVSKLLCSSQEKMMWAISSVSGQLQIKWRLLKKTLPTYAIKF